MPGVKRGCQQVALEGNLAAKYQETMRQIEL
jgi:hypothetical protein